MDQKNGTAVACALLLIYILEDYFYATHQAYYNIEHGSFNWNLF